MAKRAKSKAGGGLDPAIWGELAAWEVVDPGPRPPNAEEAALALLDRARELLLGVRGDLPGLDTWLDDLASAAVAYNWFAEDWRDPDGDGAGWGEALP